MNGPSMGIVQPKNALGFIASMSVVSAADEQVLRNTRVSSKETARWLFSILKNAGVTQMTALPLNSAPTTKGASPDPSQVRPARVASAFTMSLFTFLSSLRPFTAFFSSGLSMSSSPIYIQDSLTSPAQLVMFVPCDMT